MYWLTNVLDHYFYDSTTQYQTNTFATQPLNRMENRLLIEDCTKLHSPEGEYNFGPILKYNWRYHMIWLYITMQTKRLILN